MNSETTRKPGTPMPPQQQQHRKTSGSEAEMNPAPKFEAPEYRGAGKLESRVALITGGDSGIGRAVSVLFARKGADVAIVYLPDDQQDAETTKKAVEKEGKRCLLLPGDVTHFEFCRDCVDQAISAFGKLDILVNNAAYQMQQDNFEDITVDQFDKTFKTNIYAYFFMVKAAMPHLKPGGAIINSGSIAGLRGTARLMDYAATKGAIHAFTKSLAQNLAQRDIRVNCVAPGPVWTPFIPMSEPPEQVEKHGQKTPMKRPTQPEEIAPAYVFFASHADSSYVTGEVLTLLGGETTAA